MESHALCLDRSCPHTEASTAHVHTDRAFKYSCLSVCVCVWRTHASGPCTAVVHGLCWQHVAVGIAYHLAHPRISLAVATLGIASQLQLLAAPPHRHKRQGGTQARRHAGTQARRHADTGGREAGGRRGCVTPLSRVFVFM